MKLRHIRRRSSHAQLAGLGRRISFLLLRAMKKRAAELALSVKHNNALYRVVRGKLAE